MTEEEFRMLRKIALENAVKVASQTGSDDVDLIIEIADKFRDYILNGIQK